MEAVDDRMSVMIAPGTPEQHDIVEEEEGDEDPDWVPGDLIFRVSSTPHKTFTRRGNNLYMRKSITLREVSSFFFCLLLFLLIGSSTCCETGPVGIQSGYTALGQAHVLDGTKRQGHGTRSRAARQGQGYACLPLGDVWRLVCRVSRRLSGHIHP